MADPVNPFAPTPQPDNPDAPAAVSRDDALAAVKAKHASELENMTKDQADELAAIGEPKDAATAQKLADALTRQETARAGLKARQASELYALEPAAHGDSGQAMVAALVESLAGPAGVLGFSVGEPIDFGHGLEVYDPQSGEIIVAARPHRRQLGQPAIALTADQVVAEIVAARRNRIAMARAAA